MTGRNDSCVRFSPCLSCTPVHTFFGTTSQQATNLARHEPMPWISLDESEEDEEEDSEEGGEDDEENVSTQMEVGATSAGAPVPDCMTLPGEADEAVAPPSVEMVDCVSSLQELGKGDDEPDGVEDEVPAEDALDTWLMCDRCGKWRVVPKAVSMEATNWWTCEMNVDAAHRSCDDPEEQPSGAEVIGTAPAAQSNVYKVKTLLDVRPEGERRQFLVWWEGYTRAQASWEDEANILDRSLVAAFEAALPTTTTPVPEPPNSSSIHDEMGQFGRAPAASLSQRGYPGSSHRGSLYAAQQVDGKGTSTKFLTASTMATLAAVAPQRAPPRRPSNAPIPAPSRVRLSTRTSRTCGSDQQTQPRRKQSRTLPPTPSSSCTHPSAAKRPRQAPAPSAAAAQHPATRLASSAKAAASGTKAAASGGTKAAAGGAKTAGSQPPMPCMPSLSLSWAPKTSKSRVGGEWQVA